MTTGATLAVALAARVALVLASARRAIVHVHHHPLHHHYYYHPLCHLLSALSTSAHVAPRPAASASPTRSESALLCMTCATILASDMRSERFMAQVLQLSPSSLMSHATTKLLTLPSFPMSVRTWVPTTPNGPWAPPPWGRLRRLPPAPHRQLRIPSVRFMNPLPSGNWGFLLVLSSLFPSQALFWWHACCVASPPIVIQRSRRYLSYPTGLGGRFSLF